MWSLVTDLDKKKQALAVALEPQERAKETALEDLNKDNGMDTLLAKLDTIFFREEKN